MDEWTVRVQEELAELTGKLCALRLFIAGEKIRKLSPEMRDLLTRQSTAMAEYADILSARLCNALCNAHQDR